MDGHDIPRNILRLAEAFIFASSEPVTWKSLQPILPDQFDPVAVLEALQLHCADRGVVLVESGGVWAFRTATDLAAPLRAGLSETGRLPRVAMETVVVIALYQPLTRTDIEEIRGVAVAQGTMEELLETGLIEPWGRKETAGRPTLWVTTPRFLAQFGLASLRDLPGASSLLAAGGKSPEQRTDPTPEAAEAPACGGLNGSAG
jgi:segregation and condensation protein B